MSSSIASCVVNPVGKFRFSIDRGGTFTDVFAITPDERLITHKLLSENPGYYADAPTYAIKKIIAQETGRAFDPSKPIEPAEIEWIRMGTTVATNALLESKGDRFCLLITRGFKDLLYIGNQSRPNLFDLSIQMPRVLYDHVIEVDERVIPHKPCDADPSRRTVELDNKQSMDVVTEIDLVKLERELRDLIETKKIKNIAVLLMHSYLYHEHENLIGELASKLGFEHISLSHKIIPMVRAVPRGITTCIDSYLTPCIKEYIRKFLSAFSSVPNNVLFMQSDGGLTSVNNFTGSRAILSGPAGGVVGYALTSYSQSNRQPVIGFDMGGTSTDVSRYDGKYDHVFETVTAGYTIQTPQLDINTVAAGGGSKLFFQSGMFAVGPDSASSEPGPACYKKGGPLTITDANLLLGRLLPEFFPKIFGKNQDESLDFDASKALFQELAEKINKHQAKMNLPTMSLEEIALGYINVANAAMARPIRNLTEGKGYDTRKHILAVFGGAGGQHACAIARSLGIRRIIVNRFSGILSAYGLSLADVVNERQEPCSMNLTEEAMKSYILARLRHLEEQSIGYLVTEERFQRPNIASEIYLNLRYAGTDNSIMCMPSGDGSEAKRLEELSHSDFERTFTQRYKEEYGFTMPDRAIIVDDIRVRCVGKTNILRRQQYKKRASGSLEIKCKKSVFFDGSYLETNVYNIEDFLAEDQVAGPAIIIDKNSTILIEPNCTARLSEDGDIVIEIEEQAQLASKSTSSAETLDITTLSIFSHRFMSIAEQMRTSVSTNIKERLDYSCAMFDTNGGLVANAPHIPVHLGAMQEAVKYQIEASRSAPLKQGDVILSNHPACGGSHLPDLTVITPVFNSHKDKPVFFVANRGHHADIGGLTPGSMPPNSTRLWQEGATFKSFKLVENGTFNEKELIEAFNEPSKYPRCTGSRNLSDNISDLKAQIAANQKGIELINQLINEYGLETVLTYMGHIQKTAEESVRDLMKSLAGKAQQTEGQQCLFEAEELMDDGSNINLSITINKSDGSAVFDFSGTGYQVNSNCNAPRAITLSAIIYCLRSMLEYDIPLNQGCLQPIRVVIPKGSLLWPSEDAAVVGGNVLTSQRVVDVIFKALNICAASQGCMNNITFGNEKGGYYETVGGGAGAGPSWNGRHGVHTHMTNTRITDVEILENRYPIHLKRFSLREGSGGKGGFSGGDGLIREYIFRDELNLCVLTERRVFSPYGLDGGDSGAKGKNTLLKKNGSKINLGSKSEVKVDKGDLFRLETPGGGGFGPQTRDQQSSKVEAANKNILKSGGSLNQYDQIQTSA